MDFAVYRLFQSAIFGWIRWTDFDQTLSSAAQKEMATAMLSQSGPLDKLAATREMEEKSTLADARKIKPQVSTIRASTIQGECSPPCCRFKTKMD